MKDLLLSALRFLNVVDNNDANIDVVGSNMIMNEQDCGFVSIEEIDDHSCHIITDTNTVCFVYGQTMVNNKNINSYDELLAIFEPKTD